MAKKPRTKSEHTVQVGRRRYKLRTNKAFFPVYNEEIVKATGPQMRNLAFGSYNLLVDKILAGDDRGFPTRIRLKQLPFYSAKFRGATKARPFEFPPLNEEYVERKAFEDLDPRPLVASGFYIENLWVAEEESAEGVLYSVHVPDIEHPSGVKLQALAGWLEYGTSGVHGMPPRPHWRPVALIVRRRWQRLPKGIKVDALRAALKKLR